MENSYLFNRSLSDYISKKWSDFRKDVSYPLNFGNITTGEKEYKNMAYSSEISGLCGEGDCVWNGEIWPDFSFENRHNVVSNTKGSSALNFGNVVGYDAARGEWKIITNDDISAARNRTLEETKTRIGNMYGHANISDKNKKDMIAAGNKIIKNIKENELCLCSETLWK